MTVSTWDMYDTLCSPEQDDTVHSPEPEKLNYPDAVVDISRGAEGGMSSGSTASIGNNQRHSASVWVFFMYNSIY